MQGEKIGRVHLGSHAYSWRLGFPALQATSQHSLVPYRVVGAEGSFAGKVLDGGTARLEWSCGTVIPAVELLIQSAHLGGSAKCSVQLPPDFLSPFARRYVLCYLEVQSEGRQHFAGVTQEQIKLFEPSMAEQVSVKACN